MSFVPLETLPDDARVWAFGADRPLAPDEVERIRALTPSFLTEWTAHRAELRASFDVLERRFLVVAVDESATRASGCSIDALMDHVRGLERMLDVTLLDASPVWYRDGEKVVSVDRPGFTARAREGDVDGRTPVFDPTVETLGAIRGGAWEKPTASSWHARLLPEVTAGGPGAGA